MFPASLHPRLRSSALYYFVLLCVGVLTLRSALLTVPKLLASDQASRLVGSFAEDARAARSFYRSTGLRESTTPAYALDDESLSEAIELRYTQVCAPARVAANRALADFCALLLVLVFVAGAGMSPAYSGLREWMVTVAGFLFVGTVWLVVWPYVQRQVLELLGWAQAMLLHEDFVPVALCAGGLGLVVMLAVDAVRSWWPARKSQVLLLPPARPVPVTMLPGHQLPAASQRQPQ